MPKLASTAASSGTRHSVAHLGRLRQRLRVSGALPSSRSIMSRHEEQIDEDVVDVGEHKHANLAEHLLARLEQHGLRRCVCDTEPTTLYGVTADVRAQEAKATGAPPASVVSTEPIDANPSDARAPYYYCCVPCELRLTPVSSSAATERMLQDAHHHFASAAHRRAAALMGDPDIDATLSTTPLVDQTQTYVRVYVNGLPMLLSRRPGGGDLFYPLPFEEEACGYQADADLFGLNAAQLLEGDDRPPCYPDGTPRPRVLPSSTPTMDAVTGARPTAAYWYHPTESLFTHTRQIPHLDELAIAVRGWRSRGVRQRTARSSLRVHHVPLATYAQKTGVDPCALPLTPRVFGLVPRLLVAKGSTSKGGKRTREDTTDPVSTPSTAFPVYTQTQCAVETCFTTSSQSDQKDAGSDSKRTAASQRCVVLADSVYRIALVPLQLDAAHAEAGERRHHDSSSAGDVDRSKNKDDAGTAASLTEEALRRHVALSSQPETVSRKRAGDVGTSYLALSSRSRGSASLFGTTASASHRLSSRAHQTGEEASEESTSDSAGAESGVSTATS